MAKILKIENETVVIGKDDNSIQEVKLSDCNFEPSIGDEVEIYGSDTKIMVLKKEKKINNDSININVSNGANGTNTPIYVTSKKSVNKVLYCILALFLGGFGIHKFYGGKVGTGILFLLFCWTFIPEIIAFIEFLVALFKPTDINGNILV